jgi:hypothetical protein
MLRLPLRRRRPPPHRPPPPLPPLRGWLRTLQRLVMPTWRAAGQVGAVGNRWLAVREGAEAVMVQRQREVGAEADGILNSGWPGRGLSGGRVAL